MTDVSAMLMGRVNQPVYTQITAKSPKRTGESQPLEFTDILRRQTDLAASPEDAPAQATVRDMPRMPGLEELLLWKNPEEPEEPGEVPAELAALLTALVATPPDAAMSDIDMEVNGVVPFTVSDVQEEPTDPSPRQTGMKDNGVFLRPDGPGDAPALPFGAVQTKQMDATPTSSPPPALPADPMLESAVLSTEDASAPAPGTGGDKLLSSPAPSEAARLAGKPLTAAHLRMLHDMRAAVNITRERSGVPDAPSDGAEANLEAAPEPLPLFKRQVDIESGGGRDARPEGHPQSPAKTADPPDTIAAQATPPAQSPADGKIPVHVQRVPAAALVEHLARYAAENRAEGVTKLELQLTPEYLGKVSVVLTATKDGMTASLKSNDSAVRDLLAGNIASLQNTLRDMGVNMKNIDVTSYTAGFDFSQQPRHQAPSGDGQAREARTREATLGRMLRVSPAAAENDIYSAASAVNPYLETSAFDSRA